jgi:hypothetical protein
MTNPTRYFRADLSLYGPLTDAQLEQALRLLAGWAVSLDAHLAGGFVETTESGEDLEPGADDGPQ